MTWLSFLLAVAFAALCMSLVMRLAAEVERRTGNSGWIDVSWTFGLGAVAAGGALLSFGDGPFARKLLVAFLAIVWALRLGLHIATRSKSVSDDPRYARLKRDWGDEAPVKMRRFLQMQALASVPLAIGVILAAHNPSPSLGWRDGVAVAIFALGVLGGGLADAQLRAHAASGRGGVCAEGLWRWSRHPNYFFETVLWTSYAILAPAAGYPWGWLAWAAPVSIAFLLIRVSGIPPLEEHMLAKHGAAYRAYQSRTSAFIPLPPKVTAS